MKNLFIPLSILLFICSCSDNSFDDGTDPDGNETGFVTISLKAKQTEGNIHDLMQFYMVPDKECTMLDVNNSYDSLIWRIQDNKGYLKLMEHTYNSGSMTFSWSHSFYEEFHGYAILDGFKDGKIILSDSLKIKVNNNRDFLGFNWGDITSSDQIYTGNVNVLEPDFDISWWRRFIAGKPSINVLFQPTEDIRNDDVLAEKFYTERQEQLILDYISGLYGEPVLNIDKDGATITDTFHSIFKQEEDSFSPRYIWETATSNIVMLQSYREPEQYYVCHIYAEPR
jgi:hypothetical protein